MGTVLNSHKSWIDDDPMMGVNKKPVGKTKDGYDVIHTTYYDTKKNARISYDTVIDAREEHHYILGSGHTVHDNGDKSQWDIGNQFYFQDAHKKYVKDLVKDDDFFTYD